VIRKVLFFSIGPHNSSVDLGYHSSADRETSFQLKGRFEIFSTKEITVVILSRGRESQLQRSVEYWNQTQLQVLILHNTFSPLPTNLFESNVAYVVSTTDFASRSNIASGMIHTKYAVLCSDDELLLPFALGRMGQYLEDHEEVLSIGGRTLALGKLGSKTTATFVYRNMLGYSNLEKSVHERLLHHTKDQQDYKSGSMYRLMCSSLMSEMLKTFSQLSNVSTPYIYEVTGEIIVNGKGRGVYLEELYWIRNWVNEQVEHTNWNRKLYFHQWWGNDYYRNECNHWKKLMQVTLGDSLIPKQLDEVIEDIFEKRRVVEQREIQRSRNTKKFLPKGLKAAKHRVSLKSRRENSFEAVIHQLDSTDPQIKMELQGAVSYLI
jgi:hypothetical protein